MSSKTTIEPVSFKKYNTDYYPGGLRKSPEAKDQLKIPTYGIFAVLIVCFVVLKKLSMPKIRNVTENRRRLFYLLCEFYLKYLSLQLPVQRLCTFRPGAEVGTALCRIGSLRCWGLLCGPWRRFP